MKVYRIVSGEAPISSCCSPPLVEAVTTHPACGAPLGAEVIRLDGATVVARRELWLEQFPGWSLITSMPYTQTCEWHGLRAMPEGRPEVGSRDCLAQKRVAADLQWRSRVGIFPPPRNEHMAACVVCGRPVVTPASTRDGSIRHEKCVNLPRPQPRDLIEKFMPRPSPSRRAAKR